MPLQRVTIIGAGLCGLAMALFLQQQGKEVAVYELREPGVTSAGAIMLSPNALKTLDALGVFERIKSQGYFFRDLIFRNNDQEYLDSYEMGNSDKFGYDALRVYRQAVIDELKAMVGKAGIEVVYHKRFSHVVEETDHGVTFAFRDGDKRTTDLLIGADGIHSTVREYLHPGTKTVFNNVMALTCALPTSKIAFPFAPYQTPVQIHGPGGAFVMAAQKPDASEMLGGIQYRTHDRTRAEWDALWKDKQQLLHMIRESYDQWNPMVQSAMDSIPLDTISIWAFYSVPPLDRWSSDKGRVIILGDAAHAIPPAAGQGINQGFEDVHSLSLLIAATKSGADWRANLDFWQKYRHERVDRVVELTQEMNRRRLPGWKGDNAGAIDSTWLFDVDIGNDVASHLAKC